MLKERKKPQEIDLTKNANITWESFTDQVLLKIADKNSDVIISIGKDAAMQIRQALK